MTYAHSPAAGHLLRIGAAVALTAGVAFAMPVIHAVAASPAQPIELGISKFAFVPKEITIVPGTRVVWTNHDETPHTVAGTDRSFASKGLDTNDRFEHVFANEGDFNYICTVHPYMTGTVHVQKQ